MTDNYASLMARIRAETPVCLSIRKRTITRHDENGESKEIQVVEGIDHVLADGTKIDTGKFEVWRLRN